MEEQVGYHCINCDQTIDPNSGSLYCSEACEEQFNEDLKAEMRELKSVFSAKPIFDETEV